VTPIKRGRIIIELGGYLSPYFLQRTAMEVTEKLPFPAKLVSDQDLIDWENEEKSVKENNLNKLRWEWCIKNNILNVLTYVGKYDIENSHNGPDCR
jgi:large subunit ribosomal protein L16